MLLDEFNKWCIEQNSKTTNINDNEVLFDLFYKEKNSYRHYLEIIKDLAFEIYQLQICVEGLIEDNS